MNGYISLFLSAFIAATILPAQSEALLVYLTSQDGYDLTLLVAVATLGNTLGAVTTYALGCWARHWEGKRWFPASPKAMAKGEAWFNKFGIWVLLLTWLPIVGDAIALVAGTLRTKIIPFLILVAIGKAARYSVIAYGTMAALAHF